MRNTGTLYRIFLYAKADEQIVIEDQVNEDNSLSSKVDATPDEVIAIEELFMEVSENDGSKEGSMENDADNVTIQKST